MGRQARHKANRRAARIAAVANNPLSHAGKYTAVSDIIGAAAPVDEFIRQVARFDWREMFVRLAHLASMIANDPKGIVSERVRTMMVAPLLLPPPQGPAAPLREYAERFGGEMIVAHEEAIGLMQHLVLLYGAENNIAPSDLDLVPSVPTCLRQLTRS